MKYLLNSLFIALAILLFSCGGNDSPKTSKAENKATPTINIPDFNADSAYKYVADQVAFGPRVPNTPAHDACAKYLSGKLNEFADTVVVQKFKIRAYDGTILNGKNIIGSINPQAKKRIFISAHWDSRPYADNDPDPANHRTPIDAANDGASGVGVILEIARQMGLSKPNIGVDYIFFDTEDYGPPMDSPKRGQGEYWGLGAQYWSKNLHDPDYSPHYGILLDMVGAKDATFYMEGFSMEYASHILKKVWNTGKELGYGEYFLFENGGYIDDDHKYINEIAKIPTIDIIHLSKDTPGNSFFKYWHTIGDNMSTIDKNTLKVVGQTLLTVSYREK
ncbi:MAG: M28 family peptidase [Chlorobi bacterium]|nr:M28 family peptidase [Chlorobiota bacterium]